MDNIVTRRSDFAFSKPASRSNLSVDSEPTRVPTDLRSKKV
uniref:Uncharacterized protein n=1 Tax=Coccidioides posadasii RMSCC 3488 TaxID=454284 RepID=A0A0J6F632_COCPO|nr:hypothetical protein CPAG_01969 [Coccidioides posadasii RMSCC 3488]